MVSPSNILENLKTLLDKIYLRKKLNNADEILVTDSSKEITTTNSIGASKVSGLKTIATTGDYNDLTNKPTIPEAYTHPTYNNQSKDLYKITVDNTGHVSEATKVNTNDITSLHPDYNSKSLGLYKIQVDNKGHVSNATTLTDTDWNNLGITSNNILHEKVTVYAYLDSIDQQLAALSSSDYINGVLTTGKSGDSYTNGLLILG